MAGGMLNYTPEIENGAEAMKNAAHALNNEMDNLQRAVYQLTGDSRTSAVDAFAEVNQLWRQTGLGHNDSLDRLAVAYRKAYQDVVAADMDIARRMRP